MGIDIRSAGSDEGVGTDPVSQDPNSPSTGGWATGQVGNLSAGPSHRQTGANPNWAVPGSPSWVAQNIQAIMSSQGQSQIIGLTTTPKLNDAFSIEFIGFHFTPINQGGFDNADVLEDAVIAVGCLKRTVNQWEPVDVVFLDDQQSDVIRIIHQQMDYQAQSQGFDLIIHHYDKHGNPQSRTTLLDCEIAAVETDAVNAATQQPDTPLRIILTIKPRCVRYT